MLRQGQNLPLTIQEWESFVGAASSPCQVNLHWDGRQDPHWKGHRCARTPCATSCFIWCLLGEERLQGGRYFSSETPCRLHFVKCSTGIN